MKRAEFLVKLALEKTVCHVSEETKVLPAKSPMSSGASDISFEDFESSGTEYIPESPYSSTSADSEISKIIPFDRRIYIEEEILNNAISNPSPETIVAPIDENIENMSVSVTSTFDQQYKRKSSARERPTICSICYQDVITHFTRHLFKNNEHVIKIQQLKPKSKERLALVSALRKQGYFYLKTEKNILNPMRNSKNSNTEYFVCQYCLGHYAKNQLYKHVKICKSKPEDETKSGKKCLTKSQTFIAAMVSKNDEFLRTSRIKTEVFDNMRADNISFTAKNDPLICFYGEHLLNKHKRQQISTVISNKIREMGRLLLTLQSIDSRICGLFDILSPQNFQNLVSATKIISGYDVGTKSFRAPSLALHMGTNLKIVCDIATKLIIEKRNLPKIEWKDTDEKKREIKDLKKLIEGHWCNELSSLALKNLKEKQCNKLTTQLPLTSDIELYQSYVNNLANEAYIKLTTDLEILRNYKTLIQCVLALTIMFNRKRVGDVQYLRIDNYNNEKSTVNQDAFVQSLTPVEQIMSKKFKRVVTQGKGSKPIPILFTKRLQKFINCLLKIREDSNIVPQTNPYIFANPGSENRWMSGVKVIKKFAKECGAQHPSLLTSSKFRKHIATTLQLMTLENHEMEQIATFMGHTRKTHEEFYRLPQDIYQTAKVAKILLLLEKGRGAEFKGKTLNDIDLDNNIYYSSESEADEFNEGNIKPLLKNISNTRKKATLPIPDSMEMIVSKELDIECRTKEKSSLHENIYAESSTNENVEVTNCGQKTKALLLHDREEGTEPLGEGQNSKLKKKKWLEQ